MKQRKEPTKKEPQAPRLPLELELVFFTEAMTTQDKIIGVEVHDDLWPSEKASGIEFSECRFQKVTFAPVCEKTYFVDVIFDHCDFSNCQMSESTFRRVVFDHCRMTGTDLSRCSLQDTVFLNCALDYSNFAFSSFKNCRIKDCIAVQSSFSETRFEHFQITACRLDETEFFHSRLQGVDLSSCSIDGIALCGDELKGVVVNPAQAVDLARVLGIIIKEE